MVTGAVTQEWNFTLCKNIIISAICISTHSHCELTNLKLSNLRGESLQYCRFAATVFVDGENHQSEIAARVEAGDDEDGSSAGDVGQRHRGVHINHFQHETLLQAPIEARLTSAAEFHHVGGRMLFIIQLGSILRGGEERDISYLIEKKYFPSFPFPLTTLKLIFCRGG